MKTANNNTYNVGDTVVCGFAAGGYTHIELAGTVVKVNRVTVDIKVKDTENVLRIRKGGNNNWPCMRKVNTNIRNLRYGTRTTENLIVNRAGQRPNLTID